MATADARQAHGAGAHSIIPLLLALPPLVLLRRELGLRLLHPGRLLIACGLMIVGPYVINVFYRQPLDMLLLAVFAGFVFLLGLRHRHQHACDLAQGISKVHTLETGYSVLTLALPPMPPRLAICADAAACIGAGYAATYISGPAGLFIMLSGGALAFIEFKALAEVRRNFLDAHDTLREAERHGQMAEHHSGPSERQTPHPRTTATATGAEDIEWHLAQRRD